MSFKKEMEASLDNAYHNRVAPPRGQICSQLDVSKKALDSFTNNNIRRSRQPDMLRDILNITPMSQEENSEMLSSHFFDKKRKSNSRNL